MTVYALFAARPHDRPDLLGLYASRSEAVDAATEFLRSEDGEDFCDDTATGYGLYVETRVWLSVHRPRAPFATIDE